MSKLKEYHFYVQICGGYADGNITIKAESESEAYDEAIEYVGSKLYNAFPELDIEYNVEIDEGDEDDENKDD